MAVAHGPRSKRSKSKATHRPRSCTAHIPIWATIMDPQSRSLNKVNRKCKCGRGLGLMATVLAGSAHSHMSFAG